LPFLPILIFATNYNLNTLAKDKYWKILLHYKNNKSEIDSPSFFLSKKGKYSPLYELNATINRLVHPKYKDDNSVYCKFPARREWIKQKIPTLQIKPQNCKELKKELNEIKNISSVTLVFPTILMNSPASMFGHTLIRLDDKNGDYLNSFAINFAAQTDESNGLIYAFKGLFGGYIGKYAIVPYYEKLQEYNDIKNRDIWEYKLNLTQKEIEKLKLHLYEIKSTYSTYYYFNKNCSYQILWLLQSARPSINLVNRFNYKTLPVDTIKVINEEKLISSTKYRPSKQKIILYYYNLINNKKTALKFIKTYNFEILKNLCDKDKQYTLDLAANYLRYQYISHDISQKEYMKKFIKILKQRSKLPKEKHLNITSPTNPVLSHDSSKISLKIKKDPIITLKPAFHFKNDINIGFSNGAYIDFFKLSFTTEKIESFYFFTISSLTPRNDIFKPISWEVTLGAERFKENKHYATLKTSAGFTYEHNSFLYSFLISLKDYQKEKNYIGIAPSIHFEKNFKSLKIITTLQRNFFNFKKYNTINTQIIKKIKRNFNIKIGYEKNLNDNYFFIGFDLYFL